MTARSVIEHALTVYYDGNAELVDGILTNYDAAHRAEVLAPAADLLHDEVVAHIDRALYSSGIHHAETLLRRLAGEAGATTATATSFFQPGYTYTREHHGAVITFKVSAVSTSPDGQRTIAHGWRTDPYSAWEPTDSDDQCGWTDTAEGGAL